MAAYPSDSNGQLAALGDASRLDMQETSPAQPRLDSWKEIAAYLGRDVRTAMRWAKSQGLPVRRVAGGKGRSVFAFTHDIDGWLASQTAEAADVPLIPAVPDAADAVQSSRAAAPTISSRIVRWTIGALALVGTVALVASGAAWPAADPSDVKVTFEGNGIAFKGPRGTRVVHPFEPSAVLATLPRPGGAGVVADIDDDHVPEVLLAVSWRQSTLDPNVRSGEMLAMSTAGDVRWRFEVQDTVRFAGQSFSSPWTILDWQLSPGPGRRQIAFAAHHYTWWPGLVTLLDERGRQIGSFVNTGWVEHVQWIDNGRILISGFDNARNGGMLAVIDAHHPNGHAPDGPDPAFVCQSCPSGDPMVYAVFPRSEVNLTSSSRFNRAQAQLLGDRITVTTIEAGDTVEVPTVIYEFDLNLNFLRATYGDRYWDWHHRLELEGLIHHSRGSCPDKNGPPAIDVWTRDQGWRHVRPGESLLH